MFVKKSDISSNVFSCSAQVVTIIRQPSVQPPISLSASACPLNVQHTTRHEESVPIAILSAAAQRELDIDTSAEFRGVDEIGRYTCAECGLEFFSPPVTGSLNFYQQLTNQPWYQPVGKFEYSVAAELIKPGETVLDIGCGDGRFSEHVPEAMFTGLAPEGDAKKMGPNAIILASSLEEHAANSSDRYDWVCAFQVIEHVADPLAFFEQALGLLKPGGHLLLGAPNSDSYITGLTNFALNAPPHHVTGWNDQSLAYIEQHFNLHRAGLHYAALEEWEQVLYWMQHGYRRWRTDNRRFSADWWWSLLIPAHYLIAKLTGPWRATPQNLRGSTLVWVASRFDR